MGSLEISMDQLSDLTVGIVKGEIRSDDILTWVEDYYSGTVTKFILVDFTEAELSKLRSEELQKIAKEIKGIAALRESGKTALVVGSDLGFGFGRMFKAYAEIEDIGVEYMVFRNMPEARKWLGV